jgi:hypothetical protein
VKGGDGRKSDGRVHERISARKAGKEPGAACEHLAPLTELVFDRAGAKSNGHCRGGKISLKTANTV